MLTQETKHKFEMELKDLRNELERIGEKYHIQDKEIEKIKIGQDKLRDLIIKHP